LQEVTMPRRLLPGPATPVARADFHGRLLQLASELLELARDVCVAAGADYRGEGDPCPHHPVARLRRRRAFRASLRSAVAVLRAADLLAERELLAVGLQGERTE